MNNELVSHGEPPVGWKIISVNKNTILCESDNGKRVRYEFVQPRTEVCQELEELKSAVRKLLDGVNKRYPEKNPHEWTCPDMALLYKLVPQEKQNQ